MDIHKLISLSKEFRAAFQELYHAKKSNFGGDYYSIHPYLKKANEAQQALDSFAIKYEAGEKCNPLEIHPLYKLVWKWKKAIRETPILVKMLNPTNAQLAYSKARDSFYQYILSDEFTD